MISRLSRLPVRCRALLASVFLVSPFTPWNSHAQEQPVVFVHGLVSSGQTWSSMQSALESQLMISGLSPTLGWHYSYGTQADNLHAALAGLSDVIAVTHSNGGVLTRRYLTHNSAPRINRHVSINSPHYGAPLAANALNGNVVNWGVALYNSLAEPFGFYNEFDLTFPYVHPAAIAAASGVVENLGWIDYAIATLGYASPYWAQVLYGLVPSVLPQMVPGSSFLQEQLTQSALQTEAQRASVRASISTELSGSGQPYTLLWTDPTVMEATVYGLIAFAIARYAEYHNHSDPYLQANAYLWLEMADELAMVPIVWNYQIGALISYNPITYQYSAYRNDGIVPWPTSEYPGGTDIIRMLSALFGDLRHTAQTGSPIVTSAVSDVLRQRMGVSLRVPGGGGGSFIASISGASVVPSGSVCNYYGGSTNGVAPFAYEWYADGLLVGTSESVSVYIAAPGVALSLVVRDAANDMATSLLNITTDAGASVCYDQ